MISNDKEDLVGMGPASCDEFMKEIGDGIVGSKCECGFVKDERYKRAGENSQFGLVAELPGGGWQVGGT